MVKKNIIRIPNNKSSIASVVTKLILFSIFLTLVTISSTINQRTLSHDFITYATISESLLKSPPSLYNTFWEIHPPLLFLLLAFWIWLFGNTLISFYVLYAILLLSFYFAINLIVLKLRHNQNLMIFPVILLLDFSLTNIFNMFFPIEIIGTLLCFAAILLLIRECNFTNVTSALTLTLIATFTKEVFIFMPLALFVFLMINAKFKKRQLFYAMGISMTLITAIIWMELKLSNSVLEYIEVTKYKKEIFSINILSKLVEQIQLAPYLYIKNFTVIGFSKNVSKFVLISIFLLIIYKAVKIIKRNSRKFNFERYRHSNIVLIYLSLTAILLGFLWQGKPVDDHYAIVIVPFVLILLYDGLNRMLFMPRPTPSKKSIAKLASGITILIFLTPNINQLELAISRTTNNLKDISNNLLKMESKKELANSTFKIPGCLQVAYGWGSARYYHYSKIEPCSKYFLAELTVMSKSLSENFRLDLLANPPSAIYFNPLEADLDVNIYEKIVFPYTKVIRYCYAKDVENKFLYRAKYFENSKMKDCLSKVVK